MAEAYPLTLYREGDHFKWDGRPTSSLIVEDAAEHDAALEDGWREAADYLATSFDADHDGKPGGSIDGFDQMADEKLREAVKARGVIIHHKTGRAKMLEILREAA